jgi:hypothetical protein
VARDRLKRRARRAEDSGSAISDIIAPAAKNERPNTALPSAVNDRKDRICWENRSSPKIASTMLGVPATISIPDSTERASQDGRPYSVSHTAAPTPSGSAISVPEHRQDHRPDQRVEEAAVFDWSRSATGWVVSRSRLTY